MVTQSLVAAREEEEVPQGPPPTSPAKPGLEKSPESGEKSVTEEPKSVEPDDEDGMFSVGFLEAWRLIIRPPRRRYGDKSLGPDHLQVLLPSEKSKRLSRPLERHELELTNAQGHQLKCSHFLSCEEQRVPCVVFCHGSSSCRVDVFQIMPFLFEYNLSVFAFDFAGSGRSGGEYVTLGYREEDDLRVVVDYLSRHPHVSSIGLWGKSMGAVAAILRTSKDRRVDVCILDSPFAEFSRVVEDYVRDSAALQWIPRSAIDFCLSRVCAAVQQRVGFDPRSVQPLEVAPQCHCPALFAAAEEDRVVQAGQVRALATAWQGESIYCSLAGGHNTDRPPEFLQNACAFMWRHLQQAAEADALVTGAVDAYLRAEVPAPRRARDEQQLMSAVERYMDQRDSLNEAIEDFLQRGGSIPHFLPWRHLTDGHAVEALHQARHFVDDDGASMFSI